MTLLFDWTWKATLLLLVVRAGTTCLRSQTASLRHRLWALALAGLAIGPALSFLSPTLPIYTASSVVRVVVSGPPAIQGVTLVVEASRSNHVLWILWIWLSGIAVVLLRLIAGIVWLHWHSRPLADEGCRCLATQVAESFGVHRNVELLTGRSAIMPVTWGLLRPAILLPAEITNWSEERQRIVLSHELAHVSRGDWGWQFCAEITRAFYWFHPLVWLATRRLRQESELACDDAVLNSGIRATDYAGELLHLATTLKKSGWLSSPTLAMARTSNLERRFQSMLNSSLNRSRFSRPAQLITVLTALAVLIPLAALRAPAQIQAGTLSGTIYDPVGARIPNATVTVVNEQTNVRGTAQTGPEGSYLFTGLPSGAYELRASVPGFATYFQPQIALQDGQGVARDIHMTLGLVNETIHVTGSGVSNSSATRAAQPQRIRVGGNVQAANLLRQVKPPYPPQALAAGIEGSVVLSAVIGTDGSLSSIRVLKSMGQEIDDAAMGAVRQWVYKPTLLNGEPAEVATDITVSFNLH